MQKGRTDNDCSCIDDNTFTSFKYEENIVLVGTKFTTTTFKLQCGHKYQLKKMTILNIIIDQKNPWPLFTWYILNNT